MLIFIKSGQSIHFSYWFPRWSIVLRPIWSLGLLVLGVGHNRGIYFAFPFVYNMWIYIPTFIYGCDMIVIRSFGIFCLQQVLQPLSATLGPFTLKGAQHIVLAVWSVYGWLVLCCGFFGTFSVSVLVIVPWDEGKLYITTHLLVISDFVSLIR